MNKINSVHEILDNAYPKEITFLKVRSPFQFLICVILSAQTTDESVNKVAPELFENYPDAPSLAQADLENVKRIIRPTGFFNMKAKHIIECSKAIVEKFGTQVPVEMKDLTSLPGVGRKTANCLRSNILGLPGIIVDTHFSRVVNRVFELGTRDPDKVEAFVAKNLPDSCWSRFSMTVNLHGRVICHSTKPECEKCMLCSLCSEFGK